MYYQNIFISIFKNVNIYSLLDPKYNVEEYNQDYLYKNHVDLAYDMIHAKSMKDVLFAAMPFNHYFSESKLSNRLWVVFTKKLRFKRLKDANKAK